MCRSRKAAFGYFALPVLDGGDIVAALDLKTDRQEQKLLVQKWSWVGAGDAKGEARAALKPGSRKSWIVSSGFSWGNEAFHRDSGAIPCPRQE